MALVGGRVAEAAFPWQFQEGPTLQVRNTFLEEVGDAPAMPGSLLRHTTAPGKMMCGEADTMASPSEDEEEEEADTMASPSEAAASSAGQGAPAPGAAVSAGPPAAARGLELIKLPAHCVRNTFLHFDDEEPEPEVPERAQRYTTVPAQLNILCQTEGQCPDWSASTPGADAAPPPQHSLERTRTYDPLDEPIRQAEWAAWAGAAAEAPWSGGENGISEARTEMPTTPSAATGSAASDDSVAPEGSAAWASPMLDGAPPPPQHNLFRMSTYDPLDGPIEQHQWAAWPGLPHAEADGAQLCCYPQQAFDGFECEQAALSTDMPPCYPSGAPTAEVLNVVDAPAPPPHQEPADALMESPAVLVMLPVAFGTVMLPGEHPAAVPSQTPAQLPGGGGAGAVAMLPAPAAPKQQQQQQWQPQLSRQPQNLMQVYDPCSGVHRVSWVVDARKLRSTGSQVVSKAFDLPLRSGYTATFTMMLRPKLRQEGKGRHSFHASKGLAFVQLKCETELAAGRGHELSFRVGPGACAESDGAESLRGPVFNDFAQHSVCGLPEATEEFNFASGVHQESGTFVVLLEVLPYPSTIQ